MKAYSIFNHVLGPVMRGPSSSHTAASHRIGRVARQLLGEEVVSARFIFDRNGSYARVFRRQGSDLAFAAGLVGWPLEDERFFQALDIARASGLSIDFEVGDLPGEEHPNAVRIELADCEGRKMSATAESTGGGMFEFTTVNGWPVRITGEAYQLLVIMDREAVPTVRRLLGKLDEVIEDPWEKVREVKVLLQVDLRSKPREDSIVELESIAGIRWTRLISPVFRTLHGSALFSSGAEMVASAERRSCSLGLLAVEYEAELLGITREEVEAELRRRLEVMRSSVEAGLNDSNLAGRLQFLEPSAGKVFRAASEGRAAVGGLHSRAAARAMAVMHTNARMGVVCAAPTGGSAGVIPGALVTLMEERSLDREAAISALAASGAVGLVILHRGTFAAEEAGCQVEIGAAGAMAATAVVEAAGGSARQAADAAAISLQNTIGMPCDLVQGAVEIPCHTRNAVAASSALVCADLIMGGYGNPIPLDETIDASMEVGRSLPAGLRCTSCGGLAVTPSAKAFERKT